MRIVGDNSIVKLETAQGRLDWSDSGVLCLKMILDEIEKSGGRMIVGYEITSKEAPEWFDDKVKNHFRWRLGTKKYIANKNATNGKSKYKWTQEQIDYLFEWWTRIHHNIIAKNLGKSVSSIKSQAKALMTPELYDQRFYNRQKAGEVYNAKYAHHKRVIERKQKKGE